MTSYYERVAHQSLDPDAHRLHNASNTEGKRGIVEGGGGGRCQGLGIGEGWGDVVP